MNEILVAQFLGTVCGVVIFARAVNVIRQMDFRTRGEHYLAWLAFGLSYALLACAAAGAVLSIWSGNFAFGHLAWLGASAGLILFDRRRRAKEKEVADPEATVPMAGAR